MVYGYFKCSIIKAMQNGTLSKKTVEEIISIYADAWISQDANKIISIFTPDGIYHEYAFKKPFVGHAEIRKYWEDKITNEESDIHFKLLNVYIDDNVATAEWEADFAIGKKRERFHIREVAILEIIDKRIKSLREYWHSEKL
jgi:ketosteroid isomerase-like protein